MTSLSNRVRANRANAKKSTGPRSEPGRRRASLNRLLHGLRASTPVLPGEDPNELDELVRKVATDVQPRGVIEEFMTERVAMGIWRLRRAERAELVHRSIQKIHAPLAMNAPFPRCQPYRRADGVNLLNASVH